jgi:transposase-like protein
LKSAPAASREAAGSASGADVESVAKAGRRRTFTAADKLRIVREADACTERGEVQALLRREGIYSSHLAAWRKQLAELGTAGLGTAKRGRPPKQDAKDKRISELEKRAARLEAKLALAEKLLALQKKASEILGIKLASEGDD